MVFLADEPAFGQVVHGVRHPTEQDLREGKAHRLVPRLAPQRLFEQAAVSVQEAQVPDRGRIPRVVGTPFGQDRLEELPEERTGQELVRDNDETKQLMGALRRGVSERVRRLNHMRALACEARVGPLPGVFEGRDRARLMELFDALRVEFDRHVAERDFDGQVLFDGTRRFALHGEPAPVELPDLGSRALGLHGLSLADDTSVERALATLDRATWHLAGTLRALPPALKP